MADLSTHRQALWGQIFRVEKAWIVSAALLVLIAGFDRASFKLVLGFIFEQIQTTGAFIVLAVLAVGFLKASGAEAFLARAFEGGQIRMVALAALLGGLSPFCSCEVIPFIAALLAVGVPLAPVMAFWLASPLMDPAMFFVTAGVLGVDFAIAKTGAAVFLGIGGGLGVMVLSQFTPIFSNPLREGAKTDGCGCGSAPFLNAHKWRFWQEAPRRAIFTQTTIKNALFLGKWLLLAYIIEALMLRYIPAQSITNLLGGEGIWPIIMGAVIGGPAYLNGYAAVPLVQGMLAQGMAPGAAMSFVIAGGVSCIPAAIAIWALVKSRVFAAYIAFATIGAILAGLLWAAIVS